MIENIVGLIVEYNPFHNGHLYHIEKIDELFDNNIKIAVMSGDFVQRGEPSILNKIEKTKIALSHGIDIVIELPAYYSTQSAEIFSKGAVLSLEKFSCTHLVFGSESNNLEELRKIKKLSNAEEFQLIIKKFIKEGMSYPNAFQRAKNLNDNKNIELKSNDILGLEYLKSLDFFNSKIISHCIARKEVGYFGEKKGNFASASYIRKVLYSSKKLINLQERQKKLEEIKELMPPYCFDILRKNLKKIVELKDFYDLLSYEVFKNFEKLRDIQDMEIGLENRILGNVLKNGNFEVFFDKALSKRLTISRLQRILLHVILGITKEITGEVKNKVPYVRVLGFSEKGQKYLNFLKKSENYKERKILTSSRSLKKYLSEEEIKFYNLNEICSNIYRIKNNYENINFPIIK